MLRGSAVFNRCIRAIWDIFVPQRWGHGFYQRTGQAARAQGQTGCARKSLRWVKRPRTERLCFPWTITSYCCCINSLASLTFLPVFGSSMTPGFGFTLAAIYRLLPRLAPDWLTDPKQMHPETLKMDRWVLCPQVRHVNHMHTWLLTWLAHTHTL